MGRRNLQRHVPVFYLNVSARAGGVGCTSGMSVLAYRIPGVSSLRSGDALTTSGVE